MKTNSDYNDLLRLFDEFGVRYLIAGSYAVMKYTEPIWSKDIDLWIEPVPENAAKVFDALGRFGAPAGSLSVSDPTDPTTIFQIGVDGNRIDIMTAIPGLTFEAAWGRRGPVCLRRSDRPWGAAHWGAKSKNHYSTGRKSVGRGAGRYSTPRLPVSLNCSLGRTGISHESWCPRRCLQHYGRSVTLTRNFSVRGFPGSSV